MTMTTMMMMNIEVISLMQHWQLYYSVSLKFIKIIFFPETLNYCQVFVKSCATFERHQLLYHDDLK